ncbi:MAG: YesL family protein [Clostridia bacterium]|nr:YesL family protein [Clostridia bacterium]
MFGKMMNRFYYGKAGKGDFTKEDLPETRWQLFWEMLRVRFTALFKLNLLYVLIWIPAIIVIGRFLMLTYNALAVISDMQMQVDTGAATAEALATLNVDVANAIRAFAMQTLVLLIPCIAITGPFTAGLCYVTRNWARDEHSFILSDFFQAAKENWKQALITSTITGLIPVMLYVCYTFYGDMASNSVVFLVPQALSIMVCVLWLCCLLYIYPQMVTYEMKYTVLLRNSAIMALSCLPMTVALKLLSLVPTVIFAVVAFFTPYAVYAALVYGAYYILVGYALSRFVGASYTNGVFDRMLNARIEGAKVGRGLYQDDDEDEEAQDDSSESTEA